MKNQRPVINKEEGKKFLEDGKPKTSYKIIINQLSDIYENVDTSHFSGKEKKETCFLFCSHSNDAEEMLTKYEVGYFSVSPENGLAHSILVDEKTAQDFGENAFYKMVVWKERVLGLYLFKTEIDLKTALEIELQENKDCNKST